jgi:hypothetical protein
LKKFLLLRKTLRAEFVVFAKFLGHFILSGKNFWAVYTVGEKIVGRNYALSFSPMT